MLYSASCDAMHVELTPERERDVSERGGGIA